MVVCDLEDILFWEDDVLFDEEKVVIYYKSISGQLTLKELKKIKYLYYAKKDKVPPIISYNGIADKDPIIDYGVYVLMYLLYFKPFIRKFDITSFVDPNNSDNHLPIWIFHSMDYQDKKGCFNDFAVTKYVYNLLSVNGKNVTEIEELEYFLNHFIEWNPEIVKEAVYSNFAYGEKDFDKKLFNYLKDEFLNPDWKNILKNRNDAEQWNHDYNAVYDDEYAQWNSYHEWDVSSSYRAKPLE